MARALNSDEIEIFQNAISPERKFAQEYGAFEGLVERRDEEFELTMESAFWLNGHIPGATNS
jgi:hypothetical protein